jgi:hypothetical protein
MGTLVTSATAMRATKTKQEEEEKENRKSF